jgi:hypothetical protein
MLDRLSGIVLLPTDGSPAGPPVDLVFKDGRIAAITPATEPATRRLLAMPALVNAHDHARPLSPTSCGASGNVVARGVPRSLGQLGASCRQPLSRSPWLLLTRDPRTRSWRASGLGVRR